MDLGFDSRLPQWIWSSLVHQCRSRHFGCVPAASPQWKVTIFGRRTSGPCGGRSIAPGSLPVSLWLCECIPAKPISKTLILRDPGFPVNQRPAQHCKAQHRTWLVVMFQWARSAPQHQGHPRTTWSGTFLSPVDVVF